MTFSMPSPVEEIQLVSQYQRNSGTWSAAKRIGGIATSPAGARTGSATARAYPTPRRPSRARAESRTEAIFTRSRRDEELGEHTAVRAGRDDADPDAAELGAEDVLAVALTVH